MVTCACRLSVRMYEGIWELATSALRLFSTSHQHQPCWVHSALWWGTVTIQSLRLTTYLCVTAETNAARISTDTTPLRPKDEPRKAVSSFHQQSSSHSASPKKSLADASPQVVASKSKEKSTEEVSPFILITYLQYMEFFTVKCNNKWQYYTGVTDGVTKVWEQQAQSSPGKQVYSHSPCCVHLVT